MQTRLSKFIFFLWVPTLLFSQQKDISLEEIWSGAFRTQSLQSLNSLNDGQHYTVLENDRVARASKIVIYDYRTGNQTKVLIDGKDYPEVKAFEDYTFSKDEKKLLLSTDSESIYRRSSKGIFWVFDTDLRKLFQVSDKPIQEPTFSPDGSKVAYVYENNLYVKEIGTGKVTQITTDGKKNSIINGLTDWVYEEELSFVRAFDWNQTGDKIAFIRFDESEVPEFSMSVFGKALYPQVETFKYPKAGEKNSEVTLHIYSLNNQKTSQVDLSDYNDFYIARIGWTKEDNTLATLILNRHQNQVDLLFVDGNTAEKRRILRETDKAYIEQPEMPPFLDDNSFIWTSERDGFNHLYHFDKSGKLLNKLTEGNWDVTSFYGFDPKSKRVFYQSVENGSINRDIYSVKLNGKNKLRLSSETGSNDADFSADFSYFIQTFTNSETPPRFTLHSSKDGKKLKDIKDNQALTIRLKNYKLPVKEFSTLKVGDYDLNMWMIKPVDFDPAKKYPVFMYQYSGPGSQMVSNTWSGTNDYWYYMLAQQGYIVACVDGRGTGMRGADFKKMTYKELGKYEVEDQINAAIELGKRPYVDASRIGIWGWSYGGFMASNAIFQGADVFKMAIAVAPVTSWRFYDTIYTERYMQTPQENPSGYDDNSPINHVDKLKGAFLLVHGSADDNVHVQNSMQMIEALIQANKQFDWAIYPDKNHGIFGGNTRLQLYQKMTNFIKNNL
ncbi:MAG: S9 family peptidase [Bacteroidetes bacterium HGW-Bacteroidetes-13]|nr:MAG: S9 family peptidase [Bacteroidetes bacterium HGW-Bacteroidetes-13]